MPNTPLGASDVVTKSYIGDSVEDIRGTIRGGMGSVQTLSREELGFVFNGLRTI
jgi:hypothetical protein